MNTSNRILEAHEKAAERLARMDAAQQQAGGSRLDPTIVKIYQRDQTAAFVVIDATNNIRAPTFNSMAVIQAAAPSDPRHPGVRHLRLENFADACMTARRPLQGWPGR